MKEIIINEAEDNQRVDKYIRKLLVNASKSFIYKMFRKKNILLNDSKITGNEVVKTGDKIRIYFSDDTYNKFTSPSKTNLSDVEQVSKINIIYEDEEFIVVNKPSGVLSQSDGKLDNMVDRINYYYSQNHSSNTFKPGICNRLDRNTSGVIISGKTIKALQKINLAIKNREAKKIYITIVKGEIKDSKLLESHLIKDSAENKVSLNNDVGEGDYIKTFIEPITSNKEFTFLKVQIFTGKTHQIRAHLSSIGHPIIGDGKYGNKKINQQLKKDFNLSYQLLHAYSYELLDKTFIAPIPSEFQKLLEGFFDKNAVVQSGLVK